MTISEAHPGAPRPARRLALDYVNPARLRPDPENVRVHPKRQIKKLARSIEQYGFVAPVLIFGEQRILAGHGCVQAALLLGLPEVPVIRLEGLSDAAARALALAHNRLAEDSHWDEALLGKVLQALSLDVHIELEDTGFSVPEIDLYIEGRAGATPPAESAGDAVQAIPVAAQGDVFALGRHRLGCLDAREAGSYQALLGELKASLVVTDAPYNVAAKEIGGRGAIQHPDFVMAAGELSAAEFTQFLATVCGHLVRSSENGSLHYLFMDWKHAYELLSAARGHYAEQKALCVWAKTNGGQGAFYRSQHELVFVFKNGTGRHRNNIELGRHGRNRTNVWSYPGMNDFSRHTEEGNLLALHPSVKPVNLLADILLDASARGEIVLDPFLGSGSTLLAAERVGRVCCGMELAPRYVDTAIRRWQRQAGEAAVHVVTGKTFDELAAHGR